MGKRNLKQVTDGIFADKSTCMNWRGMPVHSSCSWVYQQRPVIRTATKETVEHLMTACELQESPYFVCYQRAVELSKGI